MGKNKILIISVLKPADEPRMYDKIGLSISKDPLLEVHVAGNTLSKSFHEQIPVLHPIYKVERRSFSRIFASIIAFRFFIKLKPDRIIICTHELLFPAILYKLIYGKKLIYDVQENYYRNFRYGGSYKVIKHALAVYIYLKHRISNSFIDHYILAEKCYSTELQFIRSNFTVLENKAIPEQNIEPRSGFKLIFTGSIGKTTGTLEAISFAKKLLAEVEGSMTIVGFSQDSAYLEKVKSSISNEGNIKLIGGDKFVDHDIILKEIKRASLGLISYENSPAVNDKIPTKMYEYMASKLPMFIPKNKNWEALCNRINAAITVDFNDPDISQIINKWKSKEFYHENTHLQVTWNSEEDKLKDIIANYLI